MLDYPDFGWVPGKRYQMRLAFEESVYRVPWIDAREQADDTWYMSYRSGGMGDFLSPPGHAPKPSTFAYWEGEQKRHHNTLRRRKRLLEAARALKGQGDCSWVLDLDDIHLVTLNQSFWARLKRWLGDHPFRPVGGFFRWFVRNEMFRPT